ncbi:hypothetical protein BJ165DRAFT_1592252 [Panaeolus papilionaceus]|nr:hypothetical protein BJ165DRAFT_1592252 [Panaeolus papilionaceus]
MVKTPSTKCAMAKAQNTLEAKIKKLIKPPKKIYEELECNYKNLDRRHMRLKDSLKRTVRCLMSRKPLFEELFAYSITNVVLSYARIFSHLRIYAQTDSVRIKNNDMPSSSSTINNTMNPPQNGLNLEAVFDSYINGDYVLPEKGSTEWSPLDKRPRLGTQPHSKKASYWQNSPANIDPTGVNAQCNQLWCMKWLNNAVNPNAKCEPLPENAVWCCSTPWANRLRPPVEANPNTNILGLGFVPPPYDTVNPMDIFLAPRNA